MEVPAIAGKYSNDNGTVKSLCVYGLATSWLVGMSALISGVLLVKIELSGKHPLSLSLTHVWEELLPLLANVLVTILNDSMGYIHNASLRWSLQREGRLDFHSNPRLFSWSRKSWQNAWYSNALYMFGIVLAYSSTSLIILTFDTKLAEILGNHEHPSTSEAKLFYVNGPALIAFGSGLLLQAIITTAALRTKVPTWSSNPLDAVRLCVQLGDNTFVSQVKRSPGRRMLSVHKKDLQDKDPEALQPRSCQESMMSVRPDVPRILVLSWLLPFSGLIWTGAIYGRIVTGDPNGILGQSWAPLQVFTGEVYNDTACVAAQCTTGTSVYHLNLSGNGGTVTTEACGLLIVAFQCFFSALLHVSELLVNMARDEDVYRRLTDVRGTDGRYNSFWAAFTSWQTILLFIFKCSVHWMFGLAINLSFELGLNMYLPQIFYLSLLTFLTAIFTTYIALQRHEGALPAAYGHIQTMANVIDEWPNTGCMYWGHKSPRCVDTEPYKVGVSVEVLPLPFHGRLYK